MVSILQLNKLFVSESYSLTSDAILLLFYFLIIFRCLSVPFHCMGCWLLLEKRILSRRRDCVCNSCHLLNGLESNAFLFSLARLLTLYFLQLPISVIRYHPEVSYLVRSPKRTSCEKVTTLYSHILYKICGLLEYKQHLFVTIAGLVELIRPNEALFDL